MAVRRHEPARKPTPAARNLDRDQLAEIRAGTDSVAALLDSVLWSSPHVGDSYTPSESEQVAFAEAIARMDAHAGIFTRYYGTFEGARVENYCPGAQFARTLLAQAWAVCAPFEPAAADRGQQDELTG